MTDIKPAAVLSAVTAVVSALLITAHNLTWRDTSAELGDTLREKCTELMGEGEYSVVTFPDGEKPEGVYKVIEGGGSTAFEVITKGYNKDGLDLLIAFDGEGKVKGVAVVAISETPGLGTNVNDSAFLSLFDGISDNVSIVKKTPSSQNEIEAVSGATYSSKGVANAVNIALSAYRQMKGGTQGE